MKGHAISLRHNTLPLSHRALLEGPRGGRPPTRRGAMERAQAALGEAAAALAAASGPSRGAAEQLHFGKVRALIEGQR